MSEQTHWGTSLMHGGPTQHEGRAEHCSAPDCLDVNDSPCDCGSEDGFHWPSCPVVQAIEAAGGFDD